MAAVLKLVAVGERYEGRGERLHGRFLKEKQNRDEPRIRPIDRQRRTECEISDGGEAQETAENGERVDEVIEDKRAIETRKMLGARLLDRMKDDADALEYFRVAKADELEPLGLADALKWPVEKVHLVRKRFVYHAQAVYQEWQDEEARRMKMRREQATTDSKGERP
jgi:hypothetical protein